MPNDVVHSGLSVFSGSGDCVGVDSKRPKLVTPARAVKFPYKLFSVAKLVPLYCGIVRFARRFYRIACSDLTLDRRGTCRFSMSGSGDASGTELKEPGRVGRLGQRDAEGAGRGIHSVMQRICPHYSVWIGGPEVRSGRESY